MTRTKRKNTGTTSAMTVMIRIFTASTAGVSAQNRQVSIPPSGCRFTRRDVTPRFDALIHHGYAYDMIDVTDVQPAGVDRFPVRKPKPPPQFDALSREI